MRNQSVTEERLKIAVFVDFDNIEIGVKTTLGVAFDIGTILEAIKERGEVVTKIAYGDWTRAGDYSRLLTQHAIKMVQRNLTPGGDKNGADINLALDALEMALTHDHINAYVIVGGDSDFLSLVEKLKQYDKTVLVVGGRAFTSIILQRNCHEFIAYENLVNVGQRRQHERGGRQGQAAPSGSSPITHALPLVRRALKVLSEREVTPQLGLLKSTLLQLDSTFSEKNYGAGSFRDFAEKLAKAGLLRLNQSGRNLLVEIKDADLEETEVPAPAAAAPPSPAEEAPRSAPEPAAQPASAAIGAGEALAAQQSEAIALMKRVLENAPNTLRWPMYVRNIKQLMRAAESGFDERRYGFGGILDLLRGGQRDGLLRLERDRQGVLRVFPGNAFQKPGGVHGAPVVEGIVAAPSEEPQTPVVAEEAGVVEAVPPSAVAFETPGEPVEGEAGVVDVEAVEMPVVTDEPIGAETPKRSRGRRPGGARKTAGVRKATKTAGGARPRPRRPRAPKSEE
jgi:uncharacterized LabA/DUF88 family protein